MTSGLGLKKWVGTISQGVWGREGSREAVEGIPGSVCTERNWGRACMVPGEERSQPQAWSMPWEKEGLFPPCFFLQKSLMWTSQASSSLLTGLLAAGKLCSETLQWHSNHWHQESPLLPRQRSLNLAAQHLEQGRRMRNGREKIPQKEQGGIFPNMEKEAFPIRK